MAARKTPGGGVLPTRGEASQPLTVRLTPSELAALDALPGATRGDKLRRLIPVAGVYQKRAELDGRKDDGGDHPLPSPDS